MASSRMRLFSCLAIGFAAAAFSAHAAESLTYLDTAARYADLRKEVESRLAHGEPPTTTLLGYLCIAEGRLKDYRALFECTTKLERAIDAGDTKLKLDQAVMFIADSDARPLPDALRARAYLELGEYPQAIDATQRLLALLKRLPETGGTSQYPTARLRIEALEIAGLAATRLGDLTLAAKAESDLRAVSYGFIGGRMWGWMKNNALAEVNMALGHYQEALEFIPDNSAPMKAVVSFVNSLGPYAYRGDSTTTLIELPRLVMRGKALAETGHGTEAKEIFDGLLASPRLKDMGDLYWIVLFERGRIAESEGDRDQAISRYRDAVEIVESQRSSISTEGAKIGFVGDKQELYARLIGLLVASGRASEAFDYVERSKSRALVDMLASKKDFAPRGTQPEEQRILLTRLDAGDLSAPVDDSSGAVSTRSLQVARRAAEQAAPELASLVSVTSVPPATLASLLPAGTSLVEYYYYKGNDLYAFVLDAASLRAARLDGTGLNDRIRAFRKSLEQPLSSDWEGQAKTLYAQIWAPLSSLVQAREVIVVPHGALHYLPFSALEDAGGQPLLQSEAFRYLPSASTLKFLKTDKIAADSLLVLGNPDLGDPRLDLPFAEGEARAVAALSGSSTLLVRGQATETSFKSEAGRFSRLHFATHGKFDADHPLDSGLYLAKDGSNDGVLTVGELYGLNLNADLVTLSACETGLGKLANGDDVVGLTRGFLYAGSRSIVASLWSVDDRATGELMKSFYENLATLDKTEALHQAQEKTRQAFPHPFFWAAFELTGSGN